MKKIFLIFFIIAGIVISSCKKDETKVELTQFIPGALLSPATNSEFVLLKANAEDTLMTFNWDAATYTFSNGDPATIAVNYTIEMDTTGNNFANFKTVYATNDLQYPMTVKAMNNFLIIKWEDLPNVLSTYDFRVRASLSESTSEDVFSDVITLNFTPYSTEVILSPIYLLGNATAAGWDNNLALEMTHIGEAGEYVIVATLSGAADTYIKFITSLGHWAPQWGTDATGTNEAGPLVYRPDESVADPLAIPAPATNGDYRILADTANLTYTITPVTGVLYLLGDATTAGWNNATPLEMTKVAPGIFEITTTLTAGGMKFLEVPGQWAPQWGTDATGTNSRGILIYRLDETVPDPTNIPSPGAGTYTITVNLATQTYTITAVK
ncbi:MAG: SusF/SusE family outer membrane protein [Lentimicrobiaceae bacterium]|nr:SusF/SusE family outer membrane protein [Lentimicrobiaceae bacterium]